MQPSEGLPCNFSSTVKPSWAGKPKSSKISCGRSFSATETAEKASSAYTVSYWLARRRRFKPRRRSGSSSTIRIFDLFILAFHLPSEDQSVGFIFTSRMLDLVPYPPSPSLSPDWQPPALVLLLTCPVRVQRGISSSPRAGMCRLPSIPSKHQVCFEYVPPFVRLPPGQMRRYRIALHPPWRVRPTPDQRR